MKNACNFIILLFISSTLFGQNTVLSNDTSRKFLDSLVAKYEEQGLKLYKSAVYESAIQKYQKAYVILDSLYKKRGNKFSDEIDLYVTDCNIALCYVKMRSFKRAFLHLNEDELWKQPLPKDKTRQIYLLAYMQFIMADIYRIKRQNDKAMEYYGVGIGNLDQIHYSSNGTLHYRYGIKEYSYSEACRNMGDLHRVTGDTAYANKYYRKIPKKK